MSDDAFDFTAPYLHMGIAVQGASDFEIEFVEVRRSGFAGIRLINPRAAGEAPAPMANVSVHDVYVHDTGGEGFYFGWTGTPPSNLFPGLQIYNCRLLRTGNEALQIQDLGDGSHVHHNVFASGGLHWLDNGLGRYQDNTTQILTRSGRVEIDHNVFVDGAGSWLNSFYAPEPGDAAMQVAYHDNYFLPPRSLRGPTSRRRVGRVDGYVREQRAPRPRVGLWPHRARSRRGRDGLRRRQLVRGRARAQDQPVGGRAGARRRHHGWGRRQGTHHRDGQRQRRRPRAHVPRRGLAPDGRSPPRRGPPRPPS